MTGAASSWGDATHPRAVGTAPGVHPRPQVMGNRAELLARVHELAYTSWTGPIFNSPAWWEATEEVQRASLVRFGVAWLIEHLSEVDPDALKTAALDVGDAMRAAGEFDRVGEQPSHAELVRRRAQPGPIARRPPV